MFFAVHNCTKRYLCSPDCSQGLTTTNQPAVNTRYKMNSPMNSKYWCFTINNPVVQKVQYIGIDGRGSEYGDDELLNDPRQWVEDHPVNYVVFQMERGDNDTVHLQGYVELEKRSRLSAMKKIDGRAHWEARKGTREQAIAYCKKDETRVAGPWEVGAPAVDNSGKRTDIEAAALCAQENGIAAVRVQHPSEYAKYHAGLKDLAVHARQEREVVKRKAKYEAVELRPWQQDLVNKLSSEPDDRKIIWVWEEVGNVGKTWMAKYLQATRGALLLDCIKKADMTYLLRDHEADTVVFNIVRSMDEAYMGHVYGVAEAIKDDLVVSTKYESTQVFLGPQHVVIFANVEPDRTKWSPDRYDVVHVGTPVPPPPSLKRARTEPKQKKPRACPECGPNACMCAQSGRTPPAP